VIVGTGRLEPIELGALVPYAEDGSTLHVWAWSKSTKCRVFKDTRLWPHERFALSPDGQWLVWASGNVLDLTSGEKSKIASTTSTMPGESWSGFKTSSSPRMAVAWRCSCPTQ
jgi:hypothetical protein